MKKRTRGFTLVEVIVVLVILGILLAIAIPVYTRYVKSAQAKACAVNRRNLETALTVTSLDGGTAADVAAAFSAQKDACSCPSGGAISYRLGDDGAVTVYCSVHAKNVSMGDAMSTIASTLQQNVGSATRLDSGAASVSGSRTARALAALSSAGIDLETLGAGSWEYSNSKNGGAFYWTGTDISSLAVGDKVVVIKYKVSSGLYSVWSSRVARISGYDYNVLQPGDGSSSNCLQGGTTYEEAFAAYQREAAAPGG